MLIPNSIFHVHTGMLCKRRAHKCQYSEDELLTKHKDVAIQRGHTEDHAKAAESRKQGGVSVYVLYMCVSQDTLCAVRSTRKHVTKYDSKTKKTQSETPRHTQA